jgi:hypothetical protein
VFNYYQEKDTSVMLLCICKGIVDCLIYRFGKVLSFNYLKTIKTYGKNVFAVKCVFHSPVQVLSILTLNIY